MSRRVIPNLQFNINQDGEPDYSIIGENAIVQDIIHSQAVWGIRDAIKCKLKHAKIIEINSTGNYLTVEKHDFRSALDKSILYFEKFEDYETCGEILKLKNKL